MVRRDLLAVGTLIAGLAIATYLFLLMGRAPFAPAATPAQERIEGLFVLIFWIAVVVFVLVEAWLLYTVVRWGPEGDGAHTSEHERGHHALEVAWTIPPVVVFLTIAVMSAQALDSIERPPDVGGASWKLVNDGQKRWCEPDNAAARDSDAICVAVTASQWQWIFTYPDQTVHNDPRYELDPSLNPQWAQLWVPEDTVVVVKATATDVIHSLYVREFGLKIDAIPGTVNSFWFNATTPGTYVLQCAEYCGGAHNDMRGYVIVYPRSDGRPFGPPLRALEEVAVTLTETSGAISLAPQTIEAAEGQTKTLNVTNRGATAHVVSIAGPFGLETAPIPPGSSARLSFLPEHSGTFAILVDGAQVAQLVVEAATRVEIELLDSPYRIEPARLAFTPGTPYVFHIRNGGSLGHNLYLGSWAASNAQKVVVARSLDVGPGGETWLNVTIPPTEARAREYWCNVPGHYTGDPAAGMYGALQIQGAAAPPPPIVRPPPTAGTPVVLVASIVATAATIGAVWVLARRP